MANSQSGRAGGGRRWRAPTRVDLLTFLVAAMLCSASYCLGIWHNSRGAADSRILGSSAATTGAGPSSCRDGDGARAADDADERLDFEAHHGAERAGLSVSSSAAATWTTSARRALRGAATTPALAGSCCTRGTRVLGTEPAVRVDGERHGRRLRQRVQAFRGAATVRAGPEPDAGAMESSRL
ncbi:unnamed protein product [Urochloa humidicola]